MASFSSVQFFFFTYLSVLLKDLHCVVCSALDSFFFKFSTQLSGDSYWSRKWKNEEAWVVPSRLHGEELRGTRIDENKLWRGKGDARDRHWSPINVIFCKSPVTFLTWVHPLSVILCSLFFLFFFSLLVTYCYILLSYFISMYIYFWIIPLYHSVF